MIKVALLCTNPSPALGPTMSAVVSMLKGQTVAPELTMDPGIYSDDMKFNALRGQYDQMQLESYSTSDIRFCIYKDDLRFRSLRDLHQQKQKQSFNGELLNSCVVGTFQVLN
ncbi:hypothetical protein AAG906_028593 [Vitis piasezkii]